MAAAADETLARAAVEGDGAAFAALYDRHERRAFNLAYRICGTREDAADATQEAFLKVLARLPRMAGRELDFGSYLLTAVRHASYDVLAAARRAEPACELPASARLVGACAPPPPEEDPDRRMLLAAQQEEIRAANAMLPPRQREVLALRELEGLSYDEIAAQMGMNRNSVAQLISRARIGLRDALRRTALGSIAPAGEDCAQALALVAMRDDGEHARGADGRLDAHLATCETCALAREAMAEAGASYRAWATIPALEALRRETIARAAQRLGHDWEAAPPPGSRRARRLARDGLIGAAAGVVLLLVVLAPRAHDGVVEAQRDAAPVATAVAQPARVVAQRSAGARAREVKPGAAASSSAPPPAAPAPAPAVAPAAKPAARPAQQKITRAPARAEQAAPAPAPVVAAGQPAVEQPADPPAVVDPLPPPPPPPPPRATVTTFVAPPPPPSPRPPRARVPSGGSSGVPVP